ncbi:MAG TPA: VOC family protein [Terriglobia bacterium]|nr:VOC family protein [Terriglobia bacterium]
MKLCINVVTLAVNDLEKSIAFYRDGLGLPCKGILGAEFEGSATEPAGAIGFFELNGGVILALYPRVDLAKDSKISHAPASSLEFSLGYLAESKDEVDSLLSQAQAAGAALTDPPHVRPWGIYSGYFKDLDGHLWEIIWNPKMLPND